MWLLLSSLAHATVLRVPEEYPTLKAAVNAAVSGDEIEVDGGLYNRGIEPDSTVDVDLTIRGVGGVAPVLPRLRVENAALVLEGVTLKGIGVVDNVLGADFAVTVTSGSLTVADSGMLPFLESRGIYGFDADITLERVTAQDHEQRVVEVVVGSLTALESTFTNNSGGALSVFEGDLIVDGSSFVGNVADSGADLIAANFQPRALTVTDSTFVGSYAKNGAGGAIAGYVVAATIDGCDFQATSATDVGGAVYFGDYGYLGLPTADTAVVTDTTFTSTTSSFAGGAVALGGVEATFEDVTFDDVAASYAGGALAISGGTVTATRATFTGYSASLGGAVYAADDPYFQLYGTRVDVVDSVFAGELDVVEAEIGGAVYVGPGEVTLDGIEVEATDATSAGGAFSVSGGTLVVRDSAVWSPSADLGGALFADKATVTFERTAVNAAKADAGSVVFASVSSLSVVDGSFVGNTSTLGGTFQLDSPPALDIRGATFCGNDGGSSLGTLVVSGPGESPRSVTYSVFQGNVTPSGAAIVVSDTGDTTLELRNLTIVDNEGPAAISVDTAKVDLRNTIVGHHDLGVYVGPAATLTGGYDLWWENAEDMLGYSSVGTFPQDVFQDPLFNGFTTGDDCASDLTLGPGSPATNAGDPAYTDTDGTPSDIGAYSGTEGPGGTGTDCSLPEVPYDGIDQDCDGEDLCDVDGDGFDAAQCNGADCDDADPDAVPGGTDLPDDGVDGDCDGFEATSWVKGGGACDAGAGAGAGAGRSIGLAALAWALTRSRRPPRGCRAR